MDDDGYGNSGEGSAPEWAAGPATLMTQVLALSPEWTGWLKDYVRDGRQEQNALHGLHCYNLGSDPRRWALWSDDSGMPLTPWCDLGVDGMIWVEWAQDDQMILGLEYRDERAEPAGHRLGLMHLPSGRETGLIFSGRPIVNVIGHGDRLLVVHPHEDAADTALGGAAVYDRELCPVLPAIANAVRILEHGRVWFWVRHERGPRWAVYDYRNLRYIVPPHYKALFGHNGGWIGITEEGHSHVHDDEGALLAQYDYQLHCSVETDAELFVERAGLWGKADLAGRIVVTPFAPSLRALQGEASALAGAPEQLRPADG
jgi:hypothetical protein